MEAFSLLKYWRGGGLGGASGGDINGSNLHTKSETKTTIVTSIANHAVETDDDEGDDGPFFDLEFTVPDDDDDDDDEAEEDGNNKNNEEDENDDVESESDDDGTDDGDEREFKFTLSSNSSNDRTDPNLTLSPSDDLFFKGRLVPIEPSCNGSEQNSKPQFPVSLLKSATKFRVFMLGFKKSKQNANEKTETNGSVATKQEEEKKPEEDTKEDNNNNKKEGSKFFTVKFKVEEVPIMSLFTRDNSSRSCSTNVKSQKQNNNNTSEVDSVSSDEKKFSKDVMQKYLKKVKPLYVRVSKRYGEKLRFSGQLSLGSGPKASPVAPPQSTVKSTAEKSQSEAESTDSAPVSNVKSVKQANIPAGLRVVCKHLGKSRSASSAVAAAPPGSAPSRRDDSLLQQQDGIQSAIMHCKRSFNASRDCESTLLSRSVSDPSREKKKSSDKGKINI